MFDEEGFMKTGDIVYIDDDGYIYIVDRLKELIKVKGLQVAPAELEAVLLAHPDVSDACVIGVSDPVAGELPRGYITLKNPNAPNKPEIVRSIHKYFGEQLAHYKQLKGGIEIIPEIPKSPSGKILRRKLRDLGNAGKPKL
jgi:acyl-coenzyme A synthetase/AMP-(fatty) acid ligase